MNTRSFRCIRLPGLLATLMAASISPAGAQDGTGGARQFEGAQRDDMEWFRDYDEQTRMATAEGRAVTVSASGTRRIGIAAIKQAMGSHIANREAVWSWPELYRVVD